MRRLKRRKLLFANAAATQEEVDKAKDELVKKCSTNLSFTGDAKSLRDLVDIAKKNSIQIFIQNKVRMYSKKHLQKQRLYLPMKMRCRKNLMRLRKN